MPEYLPESLTYKVWPDPNHDLAQSQDLYDDGTHSQ